VQPRRVKELPRLIQTSNPAPSRIGRRGQGGVAAAARGGGGAGVVWVVQGGGGDAASTSGSGLASTVAPVPYVELGFQRLGWQQWGYSGEAPGYRGGRGGGGGISGGWRRSCATSRRWRRLNCERWVGLEELEPSSG
jgi:hypothetical protein